MTETELSEEWARSQLEAWADGSLEGDSRARMAAALAADPQLQAAAERALAVRRALRASPRPRMPAALRRRLLAIPGGTAAPRLVLPVAAGVAAAVLAAAVWLRPAAAPPVPDQHVVAVQEFELAMRYLQKSAQAAQSEVTTTVGTRLREAMAASREALARQRTSPEAER